MNDLPSTTLTLLPDAAGLARAAALLTAGEVVAIPTETVYGLAGDATSPGAVARIYAAKGRPSFNPLIAHVPDEMAARREGLFNAEALALARAFWPGPLTLVVPFNPAGRVCELARAGLGSVALRVPALALTRDLLSAVGRPVAAPSANRSGHVSATSATHVLADLDGRIAAVIDAGGSPVGVESTIVACLEGAPRLLRPGGIDRARIEAVIGRSLVVTDGSGIVAPGMLASHYAPNARLRLDAAAPRAGEAWLGFGPDPDVSGAVAALSLSPGGDLTEAAANLFSALRHLDAGGAATIAVAAIPSTGLGEAIRDRLARAAAPRG